MVFQRWNVLLLTIPNSLLHKINKNWCSYKIVQNNPLSLSLHNYNEILIFQGRDTGYEIVVPRKVGSDGKFVSHQIPHHFKRSLYAPADRGGGGRVEDDAVHYRLKIGQKDYHLELRPNPSLVAPGELKIKITTCVFVLISVEKKKENILLLLDPFSIFSSPWNFNFKKIFEIGSDSNQGVNVWFHTGAVIEEHRGSAESGSNDNLLKDAKLKGMRDSQCHYLGRVHGHSGDSALSTCYGLVSPTFF